METQEITTQYSIISEKYTEFKDNQNVPARINTNDESVPDLFKEYVYAVTGWPVLIDSHTARELSTLSLTIPKLLHQIPSLYFDNNVKKIRDFYFEGDEMSAEFAMMCHKKNIETGCRLDLTYTEDGFKILEANIGSSIGGWQIHSFENLIRKFHSELTENYDQYKSKNTLKIYMNFLIEQILSKVPSIKDTINIFIDNGFDESDLDPEFADQTSLLFFNDLFKQELAKRALTGEAYSGNVSELVLIGDNLCFKDVVIHGITVLSMEIKVNTSVFRAFVTDKVYFPDHLGLKMMGDKRNLAVLLELAYAGKFQPEENQLIIKNIPWTAFIENKNIIFRDKEYNLLELLKNNKDQFVIKVARGYQGKDVFVGKFLSDDEWLEAIHTALATNAFIAQEFSGSIDFLAPNAQSEWTPHKLIWGAFGFGDSYGGVWVRMSEVKTDVGVINSATGAVEAIVFEVADK
ncbi:hypothetical protein J0383_19245 [Flavobacterium endoglycinae]|uniref:Glutathionylspermidine synthase pre-ATP-grasp-like domain-containing protein n=1 Tax=Flavobacterium endoglycinae TaxID=2816357 RepID=A0ABX7QCL8_9FLAO|nr:hypothetical protein [Flavobacterium endoglycinae]QSW88378.1 hypothetical protein J0383_19245 [Flavobacterium endoglycinae]